MLAAFVSTATAGLSLDEALERNRVYGEGLRLPGGTLTPISLETTLPDGATLALGGPGNDVPLLLRPQVRGEGGLQLRAHTSLLDGAVQLRFGGAWWAGDDHPYSLDGSSISTGFFGGRLYASVERRHWGPSWSNSLILDGAAKPLPAIGWRKTEPVPFDNFLLSWLGPWNGDLFAGELAQRSGPRHPRLLGGRFQLMPISNLELGVSRAIQWGGSGRPETLRSLAKAVLGVGENTDAGNGNAAEPGNQLAGFDVRYTFHLGTARSASLYMQAIGEDEAGYRPDHYLGTIGADTGFRFAGANVRVFLEYANTTCSGLFKEAQLGCAYRHYIYTDGYTQLGSPLGHPAGGDVLLTSAGAYVDRGSWSGALLLHHGTAYPTAQLYAKAGRLDGIDAELAWRIDPVSRIGAALYYWRDPLGSRARGQIYWQRSFP